MTERRGLGGSSCCYWSGTSTHEEALVLPDCGDDRAYEVGCPAPLRSMPRVTGESQVASIYSSLVFGRGSEPTSTASAEDRPVIAPSKRLRGCLPVTALYRISPFLRHMRSPSLPNPQGFREQSQSRQTR